MYSEYRTGMVLDRTGSLAKRRSGRGKPVAAPGGLPLTTSPPPREMTKAAVPVMAATRTTTELRQHTTTPTASTASRVRPR